MSASPGGVLVTLDGPAGVGKTTTARLLREYLGRRGYPVHTTTQPSHGVLGKTARHHTDSYHGYALACLVAADRYHHLETDVRPHLEAGHIVVCDRYVASSYVLQRMDGVPLPFVEAINAAADRPDLAVILQAPPAVTAARVAARGAHNRFHTGECTSRQENDLYEDTATRLAAGGYPVLAVQTGDRSPTGVADYLTARIADLVEGHGPEVVTA
ncbi:dTMP kinase [Amycolatopsis cihanbeyliensis]|uniref:Thymidylate kinase n=1 Tax=Amycolatopsis cihanbeyliensis TaxID=1128664 RepID=A0A542DMH3_AMYCI|nr:dTMP kinase [Amycolatopsis cihanbeyliensis]TQJ04287.1 dTMP kinase [Amycolatopsis cihanbeyliensis]